MARYWRGVTVLWIGVAMVACSDSKSPTTPPSPSNTPPGFSEVPPGAMPGLNSPDASMFLVTSAVTISSGGAGACAMTPGSGQFICPGGIRDGLSYTIRQTFYDAAGHEQPAFNRETTASTKIETTVSGTLTHQGMTMTTNRTGMMVTSGLGPNAITHTLNGSEQGTMSATLTHNGSPVSMNSTMSGATVNLVVPVRSAPDPAAYPLSGSRTHSATTTTTHPAGTTTATMTRQETFNGTSTVQIEMTTNGVTRSCTYDLAARTTTCGSR